MCVYIYNNEEIIYVIYIKYIILYIYDNEMEKDQENLWTHLEVVKLFYDKEF